MQPLELGCCNGTSAEIPPCKCQAVNDPGFPLVRRQEVKGEGGGGKGVGGGEGKGVGVQVRAVCASTVIREIAA